MSQRGPESAEDLLAAARAQLAAGAAADAWATCRRAADAARAAGRADLLADAATLVPPRDAGSDEVTAEQHALCREALDLLGDGDRVRAARLTQWLTLTADPFTRPRPGLPAPAGVPVDPDDRPNRLLELQARRRTLIGIEHAAARLDVADEVLTLAGAGTGPGAEILAWGHLYRLESLYQLARRVELNEELIGLTAVVRRLDDPAWNWRLLTVRASLALLEDRLDDAAARLDEALRAGRGSGLAEPGFVDLVLRSRLAVLSGRGLAEVEPQVRELLDGAPFFAHGWHVRLLVAMGREEEAASIWRSLSVHLHLMPRGTQEWAVGLAEGAHLAVGFGDRETAARIRPLLEPLAGLHVIGNPQTAPYGPVDLHLGRLAALLGDPAGARRHLAAAITHCRAMNAPAAGAEAQQALDALGRAPSPLTTRELEVARLVSGGASNRQIAERLHLSERTAENHVSNILRKLDLPNRAAVARWVADHG